MAYPITKIIDGVETGIKFREMFSHGKVGIFILVGQTHRLIYANDEYRGTAENAQSRFGLSDNELMTLYRDYKDDYDDVRDDVKAVELEVSAAEQYFQTNATLSDADWFMTTSGGIF